jgi:hypothetical protein
MIPPQHTVIPARRTRIVIVCGEAGLGEKVGLLLRQHSQSAAGLHIERAYSTHHL